MGSPKPVFVASVIEPASLVVLARGTVLGDRYEILQLQGKGGIGAVYKVS